MTTWTEILNREFEHHVTGGDSSHSGALQEAFGVLPGDIHTPFGGPLQSKSLPMPGTETTDIAPPERLSTTCVGTCSGEATHPFYVPYERGLVFATRDLFGELEAEKAALENHELIAELTLEAGKNADAVCRAKHPRCMCFITKKEVSVEEVGRIDITNTEEFEKPKYIYLYLGGKELAKIPFLPKRWSVTWTKTSTKFLLKVRVEGKCVPST